LFARVLYQAENGPLFESCFLTSGKHARRAPSLRALIDPESVQRLFTGQTGFRGSTTPTGAGTHRARRRTALRGKFGTRHPLRKRPARQTLVGHYAAKCFRRRGGAPRCAGSGRMKLWKLELPRPTAPNGAGLPPAWRIPTPSCKFKTRYPVRQTPTRQTLAGKYAAKCPPPAGGDAPLRGVGLAAWPSRWVTAGPDLLGRLGKRRK
jgi:hypothetical protein